MRIEAQQLLLLLNWMSPAFPTGQFAYSHGLEWAIDSNLVTSADELKTWIGDLLTRGSSWNDAVLFARCWEDDPVELNELALALATSKERHFETTQLGRSFAISARVLSPRERGEERGPPSGGIGEGQPGFAFDGDRVPLSSPIASQRVPVPAASQRSQALALSPLTRGEDEIAYPIAAGMACAAMGVDKHHALLAYLQGFCAALTSVAVRLVPLGQTAGLEALRDLMPVIAATATRAGGATLDQLGAITILADIAAMKHETQYSRVFRT